MDSQETMAERPSIDLESTAELPALDAVAHETEVISQEPAEPSDGTPRATRCADPATGAGDDCGADASSFVADPDVMWAVEHWIAQKAEELRAHQSALRTAQRERTAGVARADALSRQLGETSANLEALSDRVRILEDALSREREAAQGRAAELDEAQREATRLGQELTAARAAEAQQSAALATSGALLEQRSGALEALQRAHEALMADLQRAASELSELETRLRDSETRERDAQRAIEAQNRAHEELVQRLQHEAGTRERLAAEREVLQAQLASCLERLQSRESHRAIYASTIRELDDELAGATLRADEQEARAKRLAAELRAHAQRHEDTVRERDEARHSLDTAITEHATERGESARARSALESRLAELATEHADARALLVAMEAMLTDTRRRAEDQAAASASAAERLQTMEAEIAARQAELANARLESERDRALLSDLTAALARSQTVLAEQTRLLEERESAARTMSASHAEQAARITALRGQVEELTTRLATPEAERRTLEERLAALTKEATQSHSRLARVESMNLELRATVRQLHASLSERNAELQRATRIAATNAYALGRVQSSIDELGRGLTAPEGAPTQNQVSILTRIDGGRNHSVVLRGRTTIGRDPDNDLSLGTQSVSRHHAVLIPVFRSALLQDLRSTNGVLVNKRRVHCARLEHGDVITLGQAQFRYTVAPAAVGRGRESNATTASIRTPARHAPGKP